MIIILLLLLLLLLLLRIIYKAPYSQMLQADVQNTRKTSHNDNTAY